MALSTARVWKLQPESSSVWSSLSLHKVSITFFHLSHTYSETPRRCWDQCFSPCCVFTPNTRCMQRRRSVCLFLHDICLSSAHLCYVSLAERQCPWWGKAQQNQLPWVWILVPLEMWSQASDVISLCLNFLALEEEWQYPSHVVHLKIQQCKGSFLPRCMYCINLLKDHSKF